jgi:Tfp pilus tip-associated adhesin PilY1
MASWNAKGSTQFYSATTGVTSGISNLTEQTLSTYSGGTIPGYTLSNSVVCYPFMVNCTGTPNPSYGWYVSLIGKQEQFIYNPTISDGIIYINSVIPPDEQVQSTNCTTATATGYTYAINAATGNFSGQSVYSLNGVGTPFFVTTTGTTTNSLGQSITGPVSTGITNTAQNGPQTFTPPPQSVAPGNSVRLTWLELR